MNVPAAAEGERERENYNIFVHSLSSTAYIQYVLYRMISSFLLLLFLLFP